MFKLSQGKRFEFFNELMTFDEFPLYQSFVNYLSQEGDNDVIATAPHILNEMINWFTETFAAKIMWRNIPRNKFIQSVCENIRLIYHDSPST